MGEISGIGPSLNKGHITPVADVPKENGLSAMPGSPESAGKKPGGAAGESVIGPPSIQAPSQDPPFYPELKPLQEHDEKMREFNQKLRERCNCRDSTPMS